MQAHNGGTGPIYSMAGPSWPIGPFGGGRRALASAAFGGTAQGPLLNVLNTSHLFADHLRRGRRGEGTSHSSTADIINPILLSRTNQTKKQPKW